MDFSIINFTRMNGESRIRGWDEAVMHTCGSYFGHIPNIIRLILCALIDNYIVTFLELNMLKISIVRHGFGEAMDILYFRFFSATL